MNKDYNLNLDRSILTPGGKISWPQLANKLIINEFDTESEQNTIDGVVAHIYSTAPNNLNSRYFDFNTIRDLSISPVFQLDIIEFPTDFHLNQLFSYFTVGYG